MNTRMLGIALIVLGALALAYQGFSYTTREKVIDLGPIQASADVKRHVSLPPILGGLALGAGIFLLLTSKRSQVV